MATLLCAAERLRMAVCCLIESSKSTAQCLPRNSLPAAVACSLLAVCLRPLWSCAHRIGVADRMAIRMLARSPLARRLTCVPRISHTLRATVPVCTCIPQLDGPLSACHVPGRSAGGSVVLGTQCRGQGWEVRAYSTTPAPHDASSVGETSDPQATKSKGQSKGKRIARHRQHANPLASRYVFPIPLPDLATIFENPKLPLHVDVGTGMGEFLTAMATVRSV